MPVLWTRDTAQRRAAQIRAFRAELAELRSEGIDPIAPGQLAALDAHHDAVLAQLTGRYDIDRTAAEERLSLGMRLASAVSAAALTAAIVSFFYRIWGTLLMPAQVAALTAAPLVALAAMAVAVRRERALYVASICASVACGAFVLQTVMLGVLFNMRSTPHLLAAWSVFALAVSLPWRLPLPFAAGLVSLVSYAAALLIWTRGAPWSSFGAYSETVLVTATIAHPLWRRLPLELRGWCRGTTLALALVALLALSTFDASSLLPWPPAWTERVYQGGAAIVALAVIAHGVRTGRGETVVIGALFAALFLLGRFVDWWWDWMPKYLFFLILASVALGSLWLLRGLRRRITELSA
jgi:hypothetical protein